ncbi:hypothetical protein TrVFT333_008612 [Trichoderma virens FT-333]|nr:hypothetical protein TrVFT333_008612 [Trichoderma virens FT-333]
MIATQLNHTSFVRELCKKGADTTLAHNNGKTALHYAIIRDPEIVTLLLQYKASPIVFDKQKQTPLHFACRSGDLGIVITLVEALTDERSIDIRNDSNESALHIAAACGHLEIVRFLLERGAEALAEDSEKRTPIDLAAIAGHLGVLKTLHSHLEAVLASDKMLAINQMLVIQSISKRRLLITNFLLKTIADPNFSIQGNSPLGIAASKGYAEIAHLLLQHNAKPDFCDENGCYPLHWAVSEANTDIVTILLDNGASLNVCDSFKNTPLDRAATLGMTQMVGMLLKYKPEAYGIRDITKALHLSLAHPEIVEMLLLFEPKSALSHYCDNPLHSAVKSGFIESVRLLVDLSASLMFIPNQESITPLHQSIETIDQNTDILQLLLSKSSLKLDDFWYLDKPLILHALYHGNLNAVRLLLSQYPAMAVSKNVDGSNALHVAIQNGHSEIIEELLSASKNLSMDDRTADGLSPLHIAIISSQGVNTIQKLVGLGADLNAFDNLARTPLYAAVDLNDVDVVLCLLKLNANPNLRTLIGSAPLQLAADSAQVLDVLLIHGAEIDSADNNRGLTALMRAIKWQNEESVRTLLRHKASVNIVNKSGQTALHISVAKRSSHITHLLLEASADVSAADYEGMTPLHYASLSSEDEDIPIEHVQALLEKGAIPNCKDNKGQTPLHYAITKCSQLIMEKLVEAFIQKGLDINEKNGLQQTPLHLALALGTYDMSRFLLEKGARLDEKDKSGAGCLTFAAAGKDSKRKTEVLLEMENNRVDQTPLWDLNDRIAAFMVSMTIDLETAKVLATSDRGIFLGQNDTFSILNQCVKCGRYDAAIDFLQLGANPFSHEDGQLSAFQNASLTKDPDNPFLTACMEMVDDGPPELKHQLQILALMLEHSWSDRWPKFQQWKQVLVEQPIADYDGWMISDFIHQLSQEPPLSSMAIVPKSRTRLCAPTKLMLPRHWREIEDLECIDSLSKKGQKVSASSFRADHPFPPRNTKSRSFYYFETKIVENSANVSGPAEIGIGICGEFAKIDGRFLSQPCRTPLVCYYNNGDLYDYLSNSCEPTLEDEGFSKGDIIGCGIDWGNNEVYYTLNGVLVDRLSTNVIFRKVYPVIIIGKGAGTIKVNFGKKKENGKRLRFKFPVPR